jgi:histidyl-tRNA synthetase
VGLTGFTLHLTSLGCRSCRPEYRRALQEFLAGLDLDDATRERAAINPLRVLDDKRESVQRQLAAAPLMPQFWCQSCTEHYTQVRQYLAALQVAWSEAPRLVRGLDYYTRTTFEFSHPGLGAQSGIGGGGRYDGLMASLGGQELTGIGWGIGTDRTLLASQAEHLAVGPGNRCDVYLVALGEPARGYASALGKRLRQAGVRSDMAFGGRGLKGAMKGADRSGAKCAIIVGDAELAAGTVVVKVLSTGQQGQVSDQDLLEHVQRVIEQEEQQS